MKKTITTYACDGCGRSAKSIRDLRSFNLVHRGRGRANWDWSDNADLCEECEGRLIAAVEPILGSSTIDLRRVTDDTQSKKSSKRSAVT